MKHWTVKGQDKKLAVSLPDRVNGGQWLDCLINQEPWQFLWNPKLASLFFRKSSGSPEIPVRRLNYKTMRDRDSVEVQHEGIFSSLLGVFQTHYQSVFDIPGMDQRMASQASQGLKVKAPMVGKVLKVAVQEGQSVHRGQELLILEAMKMENKIFAAGDGLVSGLSVQPGDQVSLGQGLLTIKPESSD